MVPITILIEPCDRAVADRAVGVFFTTTTALNVTPRTQRVPIIALYIIIIVICSNQKKRKKSRTNSTVETDTSRRETIWRPWRRYNALPRATWFDLFFFFPEEDYYLFFLSFFPLLYICDRVPAPAAAHVVFSATRAPVGGAVGGFSLPTKKRK